MERIHEIDSAIKALKKERQLLELEQKQEREKIVKEELNKLDMDLHKIEGQIEVLQSSIFEKEGTISLLREQIHILQKQHREISKQRCPYVGHVWDYDFETHDQGGPLEEVCQVCGTWRPD